MKTRRFIPLILIALLLCLSACGEKEVTDEPVTVSFTNRGEPVSADGTFTGTLVRKVPEGEGVFRANDGWTYEGNFSEGKIAGNGSIRDFKTQTDEPFAGKTVTGTYNGPLVDGLPNGKGRFAQDDSGFFYEGEFSNGYIWGDGNVKGCSYILVMDGDYLEVVYEGPATNGLPDGREGKLFCADDGWTFEGPVTEDAFGPKGKIRDLVCSVSIGENEYEGVYEGEVTDLVPEGSGRFECADADNAWTYEGGFSEGKPAGEGSAENMPLKPVIMGAERPVSYTGPLKDGKASGSGTAVSTSAADVFTYTGEMEDNAPNGQGRISLPNSGKSFGGTFTDGNFTPTKAEYLREMLFLGGASGDVDLAAAGKFVDEHEELFPPAEDLEIPDEDLQPFDYDTLAGSRGSYADSLTSVYAVALASGYNNFNGSTAYYITFMDPSGRFYIFEFAGAEEFRQNAPARIWGLPLGVMNWAGSEGLSLDMLTFYGCKLEYIEN
ncbi:MAG: hypothetical protein IJM17_06735 [Firmicutes bacterium]|nr:hypothetical protein [Bacillota bacterium]